MGYVAVKGGEKAIAEAARVTEFLRTNDSSGASVSAETIETQLRLLHSRVQSEGGLYDPELASLAIKQSAGDPLEAAYFLRAYRSTRLHPHPSRCCGCILVGQCVLSNPGAFLPSPLLVPNKVLCRV